MNNFSIKPVPDADPKTTDNSKLGLIRILQAIGPYPDVEPGRRGRLIYVSATGG